MVVFLLMLPLDNHAPRPSARRGWCLVFGETEKTFELGHWQRVLFFCRPSNELLLDVRLDGALDLDFEEVEFVAVLDVLEPLIFEDGLQGGVRELVFGFESRPRGILSAVVKKLNHVHV